MYYWGRTYHYEKPIVTLYHTIFQMFDIAQAARDYALEEIAQYGLPSQINFDLSEKIALSLAQKL